MLALDSAHFIFIVFEDREETCNSCLLAVCLDSCELQIWHRGNRKLAKLILRKFK